MSTKLTKGTLVYISGSQGSNPKAYRADASDPNKMPVTFVVAENINSGTTGRGVTLGLITGINTTAYDVNAILWVNGNGVATQTRPTGSNDIIQPIGIVTDKGAGGQINVLNPGPITLPNLQSGYTWVGNSTNYPTAVTTSSIQNVVSSSYAVSASYSLSGSYALTSSYLNPVTSGYVILTQVSQSLNFADDTAAASGGVPLGGLYRNGNFIAIRIV